jgi:CubicO group peptidase (beta-lactamase class C family)
VISAVVGGTVDQGYEAVREAFAANFEHHGEVGAACCVYRHGRPVVDLWAGTTQPGGGPPYTGDSLQIVMSSSKGVVAVAAHLLAQEGKLDFDALVAEYWPGFAVEGKQGIPVRWLLSHRAGLAAVDQPLTYPEVLAWDPVIGALEAQRPLWEPGSTHGYHVGTFGWLVGEVVRRASGMSVGRYVADRIAAPLGLDLWIGLPESQTSRVAPIIPQPPPPPGTPIDGMTARLLDPTTLLHRAFVNPPVPPAAFNDPAFLAAEVPAANCVTNARSLARMYAACIGEVDGVRLFLPHTVANAMREESAGEDLVLGYTTRYSTGFQLPFPFRPMAGRGSFGHYGMGGSVGFANHGLGISFAYVMNQMLPSGGVDPRPAALVEALTRCLR